jgi:extracellular factor (EF) 3-hydroxypalmitic acid methyl ester biosynthesis protein
MLEKISDRCLCTDPLGRAFDDFFQGQAAPQAVRCRMRLVAERIIQSVRSSARQQVGIWSVGSGPAIDVELACRELTSEERSRVVVTLLDLDPDALAHAERRLTPLLSRDQLRLHRDNLFRLPRLQRLTSLLEQADFIACTGLFDYLSDSDAVAMLQCFWSHLKSDGEMMVFNFAPSNPSRAYMEWIGNWYLTYRDERAFTVLLHEAIGASLPQQIAREESQASLYAVCGKS